LNLGTSLFFSRYAHHQDLHSFPTRRSSDLLIYKRLSFQLKVAFADGISVLRADSLAGESASLVQVCRSTSADELARKPGPRRRRSEEHTSELQSRSDLVCRLLLEKKNKGHP